MPEFPSAENGESNYADQIPFGDRDQPNVPVPEHRSRPHHHSHNWLRRWWPILLIGGGLAPMIYREVYPREMAKWWVSVALQQRQEQDLIGSLKSLAAATRYDPNARKYYNEQLVRQATLRMERNPSRPESHWLLGFDKFFSGEADAAEIDAQRAVLLARNSYAQTLNSLAYLLALKNTKLDEALKLAETAIELAGEEPSIVDTRGYIRFRREEYQSARVDLDNALKTVEKNYEEAAKRSLPEVTAFKNVLTVMLYHRAKVLEKLNLTEEAAKDFQRIREFGAEPSDDLF